MHVCIYIYVYVSEPDVELYYLLGLCSLTWVAFPYHSRKHIALPLAPQCLLHHEPGHPGFPAHLACTWPPCLPASLAILAFPGPGHGRDRVGDCIQGVVFGFLGGMQKCAFGQINFICPNCCFPGVICELLEVVFHLLGSDGR